MESLVGISEHVGFEQIGMALVAFALVVKGALDVYTRRYSEKHPPPRPRCRFDCSFTIEDRQKVNDLHSLYANGKAIDPHDGVPRAFARDMVRDQIKILREIQTALIKHNARDGD